MPTAGIFNDTSISGHYGCTAVIGTLVRDLGARGVQPAYLWPVAQDWHGHEARLDGFRPDMIVVNGEGTIHHSAERSRTRDLLDVAGFARDRGLPAHLVNASVAALDAPALDALRRFTTIHVRETESRAFLADNGIDSTLVPDLSLGLSPHRPARKRSGIMVTDSVLGDTARGLRAFADSAGARHERMKPRPSGLERLRQRIGALVRPSPETRHWRPRSDPAAFAQRLSEAELIVTGRFHSVMLAILTDTPFLALASNTRKIEAVLTDVFGSTERMVTAAELADPAFAVRARHGAPFSDRERDALARYRALATAARKDMFDRITGISSA